MEATQLEDGLLGAWFSGEVVKMRHPPKSGSKALVRYHDLLADNSKDALEEWIAITMLRPPPPPPLEASGAASWLDELPLQSPLEVRHGDGWWSVVLTAHADAGGQ